LCDGYLSLSPRVFHSQSSLTCICTAVSSNREDNLPVTSSEARPTGDGDPTRLWVVGPDPDLPTTTCLNFNAHCPCPASRTKRKTCGRNGGTARHWGRGWIWIACRFCQTPAPTVAVSATVSAVHSRRRARNGAIICARPGRIESTAQVIGLRGHCGASHIT
jgi:hypothetical protein